MKVLIVGAGQNGLVTAHRLLSRGVDVTLITSKTSEELRQGPARLTQLTLPTALGMERTLDLDLWADHDHTWSTVAMNVVLDRHQQSYGFVGNLGAAGAAVEPRVKMADWLEFFEDRGGRVVIHGATVTDLDYFTRMYDAVIVTVGAGELGQLFHTDPSRPLAAEHQVVSQVYMHGLPLPEAGADLEVYSIEGAEIYVVPILTSYGIAHSVMVAARPGRENPLDLSGERARDVHGLLSTRLPHLLPELGERFRDAEMADPRDALITTVTPVVRTPIAHLGEGFVVGAGDTVVTTEPRTGQGWTVSTKLGYDLADRILGEHARGGKLDETFFAEVFSSQWEHEIRPTAAFSQLINAAHNDNPPLELLKALEQATSDPAFANTWIRGFDDLRGFEQLLDMH